jgi:hypothetical protein
MAGALDIKRATMLARRDQEERNRLAMAEEAERLARLEIDAELRPSELRRRDALRRRAYLMASGALEDKLAVRSGVSVKADAGAAAEVPPEPTELGPTPLPPVNPLVDLGALQWASEDALRAAIAAGLTAADFKGHLPTGSRGFRVADVRLLLESRKAAGV